MTVDVRGDALVLMDLPDNFTLPERYPVTWNAHLGAFSISKRHPSVSSLLKLLVQEGYLAEMPLGVGHRAPIRVEHPVRRTSQARPMARAAA